MKITWNEVRSIIHLYIMKGLLRKTAIRINLIYTWNEVGSTHFWVICKDRKYYYHSEHKLVYRKYLTEHMH